MKRILHISLTLFVCLVFVGLVRAQTTNLSGTVVDEKDAVVPGVKITILNNGNAQKRDVNTNSDGFFSAPSLAAGTYTLSAVRDGFTRIEVRDIVLNVGEDRSVRIQLKVGSVDSTVEVSSDPPLIDDSPAVGTLVNRKFVENLPLNGRSFQSLIALTPGVVMVPVGGVDSPGAGGFSVNGQRTNGNYFMVDGVSANFGANTSAALSQNLNGSLPGLTVGGGTNGLVSVDAMQEFRVQTSGYAPEYGRSPGGQISIVTRSGTNSYHGNAFDYVRNDKFDARNYFNTVPATKPALRQNDFGGTFGGPIFKDKTFFFFSYEGLRLQQPQTAIGTFYTAAARANVAAVWKPFINATPIPNGPVNPDGLTATYTASYSLPSSFDATSIKIDHNLTKNISIFGRYNHAPSKQQTRTFSQVVNNSANTDTLTLGSTMILGSKMINDFRANWSRGTGGGQQFNDDFGGAVVPADSALYPAG